MTNIVMTILFCAPALFGLYFGFKLVAKTRRFVVSASRAAGTLVAYEMEVRQVGPGETETTCYPVVEFTDAGGAKRRLRAGTGSDPKSIKEGSPVTVLYPREQPEKVEIETWGELWALPTMLIGFCGLTLLFFVAYWTLGGAR